MNILTSQKQNNLKELNETTRNQISEESDKTRKRKEELNKLRIQFGGKEYSFEEGNNEIISKELELRKSLKLHLNEVLIEVLYISINRNEWIQTNNRKNKLNVHYFIGKVLQKNIGIHSLNVDDYVIGRDLNQQCFKTNLITTINNIRKIDEMTENEMISLLGNFNSGTKTLYLLEEISDQTNCFKS